MKIEDIKFKCCRALRDFAVKKHDKSYKIYWQIKKIKRIDIKTIKIIHYIITNTQKDLAVYIRGVIARNI